MRFDGHTYAKELQEEQLPNLIFSAENKLYNPDTGFDMVYQENKVFNLKLLAKKLNGLLIKPGETFSFWQAVRHANKKTPYKEGLVLKNGKICVSSGGGLCQMSNLLFWVFLHSPLLIVERHTHRTKGFPTLANGEPEGVDATISEGWLDLKMKNNTDRIFQLVITFDDENIVISLLANKPGRLIYEIEGKDLSYYRKKDVIVEKINIYRCERSMDTRNIISEKLLYENQREVSYQLPDNTPIIERRPDTNE